MDMAEQFNRQQQILSMSVASHMEAYLYSLKHDVIHLANMLSQTNFTGSKDIEWLTRDRLHNNGIIKASIGMLNTNGNMIFSYGESDTLELVSKDIMQRQLVLSPGDASIAEMPFLIYIASPVYKQTHLQGFVFLSIRINDLANYFIGKLRSGEKDYAWIMNNKGTLLYHPTQPPMVGGNIFKADAACFKCHINFDLQKRMIEGKISPYGRYIAPTGEDKISAFSTVSIDNLSWIIVVSSPYSEVTDATKRSMELYSYLIIAIFLTTSIVSAVLIVSNKKRIKAEEVAKRKEELEKYAVELEEKVNARTTELVSEKEKLNSIVSAIGGGILLIDRQAKILWANQMIKNMLGMDVVGKYCEELWADCDISASHVKNDIETVILSTFLGQKDKFFQITTAPVKGENGEIHGYIRLIQDVTEMKKMEEQIMHSEKLASIGRLAAGIAHEIGNPLTSVFSFVQILREMEDEEFKKESLETIYFHINRISEILKQLSSFTKMPVEEQKQCNINEVIETSVNLIQYDKKAKSITITKELTPSLPDIAVNGNQLSQVFVNLTLNAIDAMPNGGTLTVRSFVKVDNIAIQFEDTGVGIPKEDITKIFDPFYTTKEKGTGLGLAVSYDIIKKMNGTLTVDSELGKGTTFTITIPVNNSKRNCHSRESGNPEE
jgi:PAS domain S-box-containing protein